MPTKLNLFPARVPIGRFMDASGKSVDVLMTPEYARALGDLMVRVGGPSAFSTDEIGALFASESHSTAAVASLVHMLADLSAQLGGLQVMAARLAAAERKLADMESLAQMGQAQRPVDWEHPGKLGAATPNAARVTTLNRITFTQPATAATFTLADGKTFTVSSTLTLTANDGATLNIGAGGTLGSAAYQNTSAFAARTNTALAAAATDAASTQTLANSLRAALISVGIGT